MGHQLSTPITSSFTEEFGNSILRAGSSCMHGWRKNMEDTHDIKLAMTNHPNWSYFAVFDGHSGGEASKYMRDNLYVELDLLTEFSVTSLTKCFLEMDRQFKHVATQGSGTTACVALINNESLQCIIVNLGDSRCIIINDAGTVKFETIDHDPIDKREYTRIEAAGGYVSDGRVCGNLNLSRAFGDFSLKNNDELSAEEQKISACPDVTILQLEKTDALVICCDGLLEKMTSIDICNFVYSQLHTKDPAMTARNLIQRNLDLGSTDNMSALVIQFTTMDLIYNDKIYKPMDFQRAFTPELIMLISNELKMYREYVPIDYLRQFTKYEQDMDLFTDLLD